MNEIYIIRMNQNTNHIFEHLVPQGTSTMLIPFIVIIETISNLIRPGTLAVRLTANICMFLDVRLNTDEIFRMIAMLTS